MSTPNPFLVIQNHLYSQIYLPGGPGTPYDLNLNILVVLVAISMLFNILALVGRIRSGSSLWVFRLAENKYGRFILPHSVLAWILSSLTFGALLQFYLNASRKNGVVGSELTGLILWRSCIWFPLWLGAYLLAWSTVLQYITSPTHEFGSKFDPARHPRIVNIIFILIPLSFAAIAQTFAFIASSHFEILFSTFKQVDAELTIAAQAVAAGNTPANQLLIKQLIGEIGIQKALFVSTWKGLWISSIFFVALEAAIFIAGAVLYFGQLKTSLIVLKDSNNVRQWESLKSAYDSLVLTCIATLIIETIYFLINIFVTVKTEEIVSGGSIGVFTTLIAVYTFGILGIVVNGTILARSFAKSKDTSNTTFSSKTGNNTSTVGIPKTFKVEIEHVTAVEFDQATQSDQYELRKLPIHRNNESLV